jgi:NADPH:quinone reductase
MMNHVARALRPGGPEVIDVASQPLPSPDALDARTVLIRVDAVGLNHADSLIRSGTYSLTLPFPYVVGLEGAGTIVATGPETSLRAGARVCWTGVFGSCAAFVVAPEAMLAPLPDHVTAEEGARLAHAGVTSGGLARVWPLNAHTGDAVIWAAAGAVGRLLIARLAARGVDVIGIASGPGVAAAREAGATYVVDRATEDVREAVRAHTAGRGVAAVFDPVGADTFETSVQFLAPRGCLINYGELSGPVPAIDIRRLFTTGGIFVTKFNGRAYVDGPPDAVGLIGEAIALAAARPAVMTDVTGRFPLDRAADAYRLLESGARGKVLVLPQPSQA